MSARALLEERVRSEVQRHPVSSIGPRPTASTAPSFEHDDACAVASGVGSSGETCEATSDHGDIDRGGLELAER